MKARRRKIQVWIYSQERGDWRFLVLKTNPERGAFWQPVTGGVEAGEEFEAAALREAGEETGFEISGTLLQKLGYTFEFESPWGPATEETFALEAPAGCPEPRLDPKEHTAFAWLAPQDALERVKFESNREALRVLLKSKNLGGLRGNP